VHKLVKFEKYLFLLVVILSLAPIIDTTFFPSLDGPSHLYNANLIKELLFDQNAYLAAYYSMNPILAPNWIGHFILMSFDLFLSAAYAEKWLLLIYFIGLPLAFRSLIHAISPKGIWASYLVFPFLYSAVLSMGFYNFSLALIFLFFTLSFLLNNKENLGNPRIFFILFVLITVTYFSHLFIFILLLFFIGLHIFWKGLSDVLQKETDTNRAIQKSLKKAGWLVAISFLPLVLLILYVIDQTPSGNNNYLSVTELWRALFNIDAIIAYDRNVEQMYTRKIFYILAGLSIFALGKWAYLKFIRKEQLSYTQSGFWVIAILIILLLYFFLPDSDEIAGFFSVRLSMLFYLFLIIWLSTQKIPKWVSLPIICFAVLFTYQLNGFYRKQLMDLNLIAMECLQASKFVEENSLVLPINRFDNWLLKHFSNYLGVEKPMVVLENYEATTDYFPILWNEKSLPNIFLGDEDGKNFPCLYWKSNGKNQMQKADYVFVLGNLDEKKDKCNQLIGKEIKRKYDLIFNSKNTQLFSLKKEK